MPTEFDYVPPKRIVKPRKRKVKRLPVVVIAGKQAMDELGMVATVDEYLADLRSLRSTLFAKQAAADFVAYLDRTYSVTHPEQWQWRASDHERAIIRPDGVHVASRISTLIHYFGFKGGYYHKILDPVTMYGQKLDEIWPGDEPDLVRLMRWATNIRDFCFSNGLEVRPTIGGISGQFLTDPHFYPDARRKVPATINARTREALPGNHYTLTVTPTPHREFTALYIDQSKAHHYHAKVTPLPDSNHLYAHGDFINLSEVVFNQTDSDFYGLYALDLAEPRAERGLHWVKKLTCAFVFSNELQHLLDMGYRILGVRAMWGAYQRDVGLTKYAEWAIEQLDKHNGAPWIKPLLLATYGTLATRPKHSESVFRLATRGELATLITGHNQLSGKSTRSPHKIEPRYANVLHRGMIEAATRSESVGFAQHLTHLDYRVLSIYADAVIVEDNPEKPLPPMIEPWRLKNRLNHLQFINQQAFMSGELTKLPGVSSEARAYRQHAPGHSPRKVQYEAITGRPVKTDRRI